MQWRHWPNLAVKQAITSSVNTCRNIWFQECAGPKFPWRNMHIISILVFKGSSVMDFSCMVQALLVFYWRISLCPSQCNPIWKEAIITRLGLDIRLLTLIVSWLNKIRCYFFSFSDAIMHWNTNSYASDDINGKISFFWLLMTSIRWKIVGDWIAFVWRWEDGQLVLSQEAMENEIACTKGWTDSD